MAIPPRLPGEKKGRLRVGARHIRAPEVVLGLDLPGAAQVVQWWMVSNGIINGKLWLVYMVSSGDGSLWLV